MYRAAFRNKNGTSPAPLAPRPKAAASGQQEHQGDQPFRLESRHRQDHAASHRQSQTEDPGSKIPLIINAHLIFTP